MPTLSTHHPASPAVPLAPALEQAARDAEAVPGAYARAPWGFASAPPAASAVLDQLAGNGDEWVLVTFRRGDADGHLRERSFTAVQRYLLSLAAEGIDATWIGDGLPPQIPTLAQIGADRELLGVIRVSA